MGERGGPSAGPVFRKGSYALLSLPDGSRGADVGGRAEATQQESLLPAMESVLPGVGRQGHEGPSPQLLPTRSLFPDTTWLL